jgi:hypothetical protein
MRFLLVSFFSFFFFTIPLQRRRTNIEILIEKIFFIIHDNDTGQKKTGKSVEEDWMTTEEKPEKN